MDSIYFVEIEIKNNNKLTKYHLYPYLQEEIYFIII